MVNEKLLPYLREVHETFKKGFENDEMREIFLRNLFEEIAGHEAELSLIKNASFLLEDFLSACNHDIINTFLKDLINSFQDVAYSDSASHILQTLFERFTRLTAIKNDDDVEIKQDIAKNVKTISDKLFCKESIVDFMMDPHATHVVRATVNVLAGRVRKQSPLSKQPDLVLDKEELPKGFLSKLKDLSTVLQELPTQDFALLFTNVNGGPCIGCILTSLQLRLPKRSKNFCKAILGSSGENQKMIMILSKDKVGSHLMETIIQAETTWKIVFDALKKDELIEEMCLHPIGNFVIQKLILHAPNEEEFGRIFEVIIANATSIFIANKMGVIYNTAQKCLTFKTFQAEFLDEILKLFLCAEVEKRKFIIPLISCLMNYDEFTNQNYSEESLKDVQINYHGSLILQTLIKFENIGLLLTSVTDIPIMYIVKLVCDPKGSHFMDEVIKCERVKVKKKRQLLLLLQPYLARFACDKFGSRFLDNFWKLSNLEMKEIIMKELLESKKDLLRSNYGKHIFHTYGVKLYGERKENWLKFQKHNQNKRKLFAEILDDKSKKIKSQ